MTRSHVTELQRTVACRPAWRESKAGGRDDGGNEEQGGDREALRGKGQLLPEGAEEKQRRGIVVCSYTAY